MKKTGWHLFFKNLSDISNNFQIPFLIFSPNKIQALSTFHLELQKTKNCWDTVSNKNVKIEKFSK